MRAHNETFLEEILPPEDRVIEAVVARYQRVAPAVTRFARSIAGNDELRVRLGSKASASKDEIVINPGIFQAAYARSAPVTPTEVALTSALHEAIHLIATDFDEERPIPESWLAHRRTLDDDGAEPPPLAELTSYDWIEPEAEFGDDTAPHPLDDLFEPDHLPTNGPVTLLDALHTVAGPAAEAMFLSLEDARQERRHLAPYPGARSVLSDLYRAAVPGAAANARPLGQFALACFLIVGGYFDRDDLQRRVAPHVALALDDAVPFLDAVTELDDPWSVGGVALQLIEVARMHGLLTEGAAADSSVGRRTEMAADQMAIAESVDAVRIVTPPLADRDGYEETRNAAQTVSAEHGRHGEADQAGDPATDQLMKVSTAPTVYLPTGQAGKLVVSDFPVEFRRFAHQGRDLLEIAIREWGVAQRRVSGELYPLFLANQRRGLRTGFDAGDLSPYTPLLLGAGLYERMLTTGPSESPLVRREPARGRIRVDAPTPRGSGGTETAVGPGRCDPRRLDTRPPGRRTPDRIRSGHLQSRVRCRRGRHGAIFQRAESPRHRSAPARTRRRSREAHPHREPLRRQILRLTLASRGGCARRTLLDGRGAARGCQGSKEGPECGTPVVDVRQSRQR